MKRILAVFLCVIILVTMMSSCSSAKKFTEGASLSEVFGALSDDVFGKREEHIDEVSKTTVSLEKFVPSPSRYAYDQLETDAMKITYEQIKENLYFISDEADEKGLYRTKITPIPDLTTLEIFKVKEAVLADNPEIFWISGKYSIGSNGHDGEYITLYSPYSKTQVEEKNSRFQSAVKEIFAQMPTNMDEYEREKFLHDYLLKNCKYDNEAADNKDEFPSAFNAYGALVEGRAVCAGYADAMKYLLNMAGIDCITVLGESKGEGHKWNAVKIEGDWYQLDPTWNDPREDNEEEVEYWYFNITDEQMKTDHKYAIEFSQVTNEMITGENPPPYYNFDLPQSTSKKENLFEKNAFKVTALDYQMKKELAGHLEKIVGDGGDKLYMMYTSDYTTEQVLEWFSNDSGDDAFNYAATMVNEVFPERQIKKYRANWLDDTDADTVWNNIIIVKILYD